MGLEFALTIGILGWLGWLLDRELGLAFPVFLLVGVFAGLVGGILRMKSRLDAASPKRRGDPESAGQKHAKHTEPR